VTLEVEVLPDAEAVASQAATEVATIAREVVDARGRFTFAVSGGRTPWSMFSALRTIDVPWERVELFQVDERVAPPGSPDRNLTHLIASLPPLAVGQVHALPVNDDDLDAAADRYARELPDRFDLVHLGLGPDGHTASLVPGDPVLEITARAVASTQPYQQNRRMTLTYPTLNRAERVLWLVTGPEKVDALKKLRAGDRSIPAGRVEAADQCVLCDAAAAG
jgi:6-phosphogluconolactonase